MYDPFGLTGKVLPKGIDSFVEKGPLGNAGGIKAAAGPKMGSMLSGRAILQGGPKEQNMESARTFDVFGSPATAGTKQQSTARLGALLYGAWMAGALGGLGGGTGATSASYSPAAMDVPAAGAGPSATTAGGMPAWMKYARMGNMASGLLGGQQPQDQGNRPRQFQIHPSSPVSIAVASPYARMLANRGLL